MNLTLDSPALRATRRLSAVTVLPAALLALCLVAAPALAKDGQVTVRAAGITNESVTVKLDELGTNDINNREYRLQSGQVTISGHSLRQIMERADAESGEIDFETIPSITIDRPSGQPITISGDDARDPGAFPDGPPVFYEDNGATVLVMPGATPGTSGNRYRFVQAPVGISVGSQAVYEVNLSASRTKVMAGQKVNFTATVSGQEKGETLSFEWNFNDGSSRQTSVPRVTHNFTRKGSFPVILDVTGASGSGQSGISIEVGEAEKKPDRKKPENKPEGNGGTGGQTGGVGGLGDGFGTGTGSFGTDAGGGLPGGSLPLVQPSAPVPLTTPRPEPEPRQDPPEADGLVEVTGELVDPSSGETVVAPGDPLVTESADPATSGTEQGGFGIPGEAWALAGVGLLLGFGGFAELRIFSRFY